MGQEPITEALMEPGPDFSVVVTELYMSPSADRFPFRLVLRIVDRPTQGICLKAAFATFIYDFVGFGVVSATTETTFAVDVDPVTRVPKAILERIS